MEWANDLIQSGVEGARATNLDWWTIFSIVIGGAVASAIAWWQQRASNRSLRRQLWHIAQLQVFLLLATSPREKLTEDRKGRTDIYRVRAAENEKVAIHLDHKREEFSIWRTWVGSAHPDPKDLQRIVDEKKADSDSARTP